MGELDDQSKASAGSHGPRLPIRSVAGIAAALALSAGAGLAVAGVAALFGRPLENVATGVASLVALVAAVGAVVRSFRHPEGIVVAWNEALARAPLRPRWLMRIVLLLLLVALLVDRTQNPGGPPKREGEMTYRQVVDGVFEPVDELAFVRLAGYQVAIAQLFLAALALAAAAIWNPAPVAIARGGAGGAGGVGGVGGER